MKNKEEIKQLAEDQCNTMESRIGFAWGYKQCQEDMADKIKEVYEQGLSDGYACMPSTISPLNKQD
jgi:hypothetical protein